MASESGSITWKILHQHQLPSQGLPDLCNASFELVTLVDSWRFSPISQSETFELIQVLLRAYR